MLLAQAQFTLRAYHAVRWDTTNLRRLQLFLRPGLLVAVGIDQDRTSTGKCDFQDGQILHTLICKQVGRAGDDLLRRGCAIIDIHQHQPVSIGMWLHRHNATYNDGLRVPPIADVFNALDLQSRQRQSLCQLLYRQVQVHIFF